MNTNQKKNYFIDLILFFTFSILMVGSSSSALECAPNSVVACTDQGTKGHKICNESGRFTNGSECIRNFCEPNTVDACSIGANQGTRKCNDVGTAYLTVCQNQVCVPKVTSYCNIDQNGTGNTTCSDLGDTTSPCVLVRCNYGYTKTNGSCVNSIAAGFSITFPTATSTYRKSTLVIGTCEVSTASLWTNVGSFLDADCSDGKWMLSVPLANGSNIISVTASSTTGVSVERSITVNSNVSGLDPLEKYAWHLNNTGQNNFASNGGTPGSDLNVADANSHGFIGSNIIVAVSDSGLDVAHADLVGNILDGRSRDYRSTIKPSNCSDPNSKILHCFDGGDPTPSPSTASDPGDHGTSVAGIIASSMGNGVGSRGVAPDAYLVGYNYLGVKSQTLSGLENQAMGDVDVINSSWGNRGIKGMKCDNTTYNWNFASNYTSLEKTMHDGSLGILRPNNKSIIYVKSAGNDYSNAFTASTKCGRGSEASLDPITTYPYAIVVGALESTNVRAYYSSVSSVLWISGFGGNNGYINNVTSSFNGMNNINMSLPAIMSTDQSGCENGYVGRIMDVHRRHNKTSNVADLDVNLFNKPDGDNNYHPENTNCDYTSMMNGTSAATPSVSGVVALMLNANPSLSFRDVRYILASTAVKIDPSNATWITNAANFHFSNHYGFGRIDASAAVNMALSYHTIFPPNPDTNFLRFSESLSTALSIPDSDPVGVSSSMTVSSNFNIENARIVLNATHPHVGDLRVQLRSPSGTVSTLLNSKSKLNGTANFAGVSLSSNAFLGEAAQGVWTLKVIDDVGVDVGSLTSWTLMLYGY